MTGRNSNEKRIDCGRKEDLMTFIYGEFTPDEERSFNQHLHECANCQSEAAGFRAVRDNLQSWQIDSAPRISLDLGAERPRSLRAIINELASALPSWFKYGTAFAAACSLILVLLAVLNTQVRYDNNGLSVQVALFKSSATPNNPAMKEELEKTARDMVAQMISQEKAQIRQDLETQIAQLNRELSEKNSAALSRAALELKTEQRERLQQALFELENYRKDNSREPEDDPFDLWGSVDERTYRQGEGRARGTN
jgi:anti-sigma factor RsiW